MPRLEPVEKLPLAVRKNIRDEWDQKKEDLEKQLSDLLGESWTVDIDPKKIYPYGEENSYSTNSIGSMLNQYVESAISQLKYIFDNYYGDDGKAELNSVCSAHVLTLDLDEEKRFTYNGCAVSPEGALVLLFEENYLGVNINDCVEKDKLTKAINDAPSDKPMSFVARNAIKKDWDGPIAEVQTKINKLLNKEITFEPQFDENFAALKAAGSNAQDRWEQNFGNFTHLYFNGLASNLEYQKFGEDDLLQEGFHEGVESAKVVFRVVDKSKMKSSYNESVIEDGVLYMQTVPEYFGTNVDDIARNVVDLL